MTESPFNILLILWNYLEFPTPVDLKIKTTNIRDILGELAIVYKT